MIDQKPLIFNDEIGAKLLAEPGWQNRKDMNLEFSMSMRSSINGRAQFIEDLLEIQAAQGISQYVILGAGLDTFGQRRPELASMAAG
ncbi:MAG: class I SAM-dependent methyltransferase [Bdellovibrionaceae bacterium]|nr:class I SAM-dependent methyltransferase [Pseudobdellovibrionaceae bacterium]